MHHKCRLLVTASGIRGSGELLGLSGPGQHPPEFVGLGPAHCPPSDLVKRYSIVLRQSVGSPVVAAGGLCQPLSAELRPAANRNKMRGQPQASERCTGKKAAGADQRKEQSRKLLYRRSEVRGLGGPRFLTSGRTGAWASSFGRSR